MMYVISIEQPDISETILNSDHTKLISTRIAFRHFAIAKDHFNSFVFAVSSTAHLIGTLSTHVSFYTKKGPAKFVLIALFMLKTDKVSLNFMARQSELTKRSIYYIPKKFFLENEMTSKTTSGHERYRYTTLLDIPLGKE